MASLQLGKSYTLREDFSGEGCVGRVISFVADDDGLPAAIFDVSDDIERNKKLWGDTVIAMTYYPDMPIDNFTMSIALVSFLKIDHVPDAGTVVHASDGKSIGSGRGRIEGDFT